jgi:hypothetical protein
MDEWSPDVEIDLLTNLMIGAIPYYGPLWGPLKTTAKGRRKSGLRTSPHSGEISSSLASKLLYLTGKYDLWSLHSKWDPSSYFLHNLQKSEETTQIWSPLCNPASVAGVTVNTTLLRGFQGLVLLFHFLPHKWEQVLQYWSYASLLTARTPRSWYGF